jgi:hypothetical protein
VPKERYSRHISKQAKHLLLLRIPRQRLQGVTAWVPEVTEILGMGRSISSPAHRLQPYFTSTRMMRTPRLRDGVSNPQIEHLVAGQNPIASTCAAFRALAKHKKDFD